MEILRNRQSLSDYIAAVKKEGKKIGFAPTMGALHDGHMSLYKEARKDNDIVISSVFVNPTQFNNPDDLKKYPRTEENDIAMLEKAGVDAVYIPTIEDIYPAKAESKHYDFGGIENEMEGKFRPGHFDGVGTVVSELFRQVQPDNAYFGEKDYQQLAIIKKLVEIEKFPIKIHGVPIYRAENGLALSSRNARLSEEERNGATLIYKTLVKVNEWFRVISIPEIKKRVEEIFEQSDYELEYFLVADEETLKETDFFYKDKNYRAFIVVFVGEVRLIDNMHMD
ncbi:pantoate--beta-alanine ligase [Elizabethkingia anophelis]|uniref:pantoate--beta-alanine ligase n=1 Tax=Elizabethkingia anophelis TaxID=1117645 RepID=UPI0021A6CCDD|nr:pantoate--beta-alanine ligase [Elizabethkingia anophelis]MCT3977748.1 pantoate--beta-alanine ligase [Elizabethkingia anophelis]MCT4041363.1 pantoate--beta-alanine ligase [Elizabethkingia anophelis]MCT4174059.1 pantoate--beta-alanine ligase [Elizabethkingia anophelis]MCT4177740.1 pantoate--beta-alanine ligase [Elizabethkingia anophelis]